MKLEAKPVRLLERRTGSAPQAFAANSIRSLHTIRKSKKM